MKLFTAIFAIQNYVVRGPDAINANFQSPPPAEPKYVKVDAQYMDWYKKRFGIELDCMVHVLPVLYDLEVHLESGALWTNLIEEHLKDLGFVSSTHETFLYRGFDQDQQEKRLIDDFMFSFKME